MDSAVAARPPGELPQMEAADHHLRWIGEAVLQPGNLLRLESTGPVRLLQLAPQPRLIVGGADEEAVLEVTGELGSVLQVVDRLSLGSQSRRLRQR